MRKISAPEESGCLILVNMCQNIIFTFMVLKETPNRKEIILYYFMLILGKFKNQTVKKKKIKQ